MIFSDTRVTFTQIMVLMGGLLLKMINITSDVLNLTALKICFRKRSDMGKEVRNLFIEGFSAFNHILIKVHLNVLILTHEAWPKM